MSKLTLVTATLLCLLIASTGCDTMNRGVTAVPDRGPVIGQVTVTSATSMNAGEPGTITVPWEGGSAPFVISVVVGNTLSLAADTDAGVSPFTRDFALEEGRIEWEVALTDSLGRSSHSFGSYVSNEAMIPDPTITNVAVDGGVLTVTVADCEGDDITVTVTDITGLSVHTNQIVVPGGNGDAVFYWTADDIFAGGSGTTTITMADADTNPGCEATDTATITIEPVYPAPAEGQLIAFPLQDTAAVDETVTILVVSGPFPADAAFNFMNGVAVTVTKGAQLVGGSFNVGSIGGAQKDVDGIWDAMVPAPATFFIPEDFMMMPTPLPEDDPRIYMGFNVTPIGAGEVTTGGDMFNFGVTFDSPGEYELGFLEFFHVKRTYYSDNAATEYNWLDLSNDFEYARTITVN